MQKILIYLVFGLMGISRPGYSESGASPASPAGEDAGSEPSVNMKLLDEPAAGGLTQKEILEVIRAGLTPIRQCYVKRLKVKKNLSGKIKTFWTVNAAGKVDTAEVVESTLKDSRLESCVVKVIQGWRFPKPRGGLPVQVTYPFAFNPDL